MASLSMGEIAKMQADAAQRVREMGQRSRQLTGGASTPNQPNPPPKQAAPQNPPPPKAPPCPDEHTPNKNDNSVLGGLLNFLPFDIPSDRLLIFLLIYLLGAEKGDKLLLLALLYLAF